MANTASANQSTVAGAAMPSNLPSQLQRAPSEQELEIARHLIEHSQSQPAVQLVESQRINGYMQEVRSAGSELGSDISNHEHHDLNDSLQGFAQPYGDAQGMQSSSTPTQRRQPSSGAIPPGGQMCRYTSLTSISPMQELI